MRKLLIVLATVLVLSGCGQPGELPLPPVHVNTVKGIPYLDYGIERFRAIEIACFIDTSRHSPLNALDYTLEKSGTQFFDYVILGGASLNLDSKGFYVSLSDDLLKVLARRNSLVAPLQKKGIRVLLGIQSQGKASFGNVTEDQMNELASTIYELLRIYWLDGVEFFDNGAPEAYPPNVGLYDPESGQGRDEWELEQWEKGADSFNNFFYTIRNKFSAETRENVPLFLREINYGRFFPDMVSCTAGFADFASSSAQITYSFNNDPAVFKAKSDQRYAGQYGAGASYGDTWLQDEQFGPFFLELSGSPQNNVFFPMLKNADENNYHPSGWWGEDLSYFIKRFKNGRYCAIYCNGLQPISETKNDPFYQNLFFNPKQAETEEFANENGDWLNSKHIPALYIFSEITKELFGEGVVCSGGDRQKTW